MPEARSPSPRGGGRTQIGVGGRTHFGFGGRPHFGNPGRTHFVLAGRSTSESASSRRNSPSSTTSTSKLTATRASTRPTLQRCSCPGRQLSETTWTRTARRSSSTSAGPISWASGTARTASPPPRQAEHLNLAGASGTSGASVSGRASSYALRLSKILSANTSSDDLSFAQQRERALWLVAALETQPS